MPTFLVTDQLRYLLARGRLGAGPEPLPAGLALAVGGAGGRAPVRPAASAAAELPQRAAGGQQRAGQGATAPLPPETCAVGSSREGLPRGSAPCAAALPQGSSLGCGPASGERGLARRHLHWADGSSRRCAALSVAVWQPGVRATSAALGWRRTGGVWATGEFYLRASATSWFPLSG